MPTGRVCCLCMVSLARQRQSPNRKGTAQGCALCIQHIHSRYSSVTTMLQSLNWKSLQPCRVNMRLCIIYKACYNLAMFPFCWTTQPSPQSTHGAITSSLSLPTVVKMCTSTLFYRWHSAVGTPSHSWQWRLKPWTHSRPASQPRVARPRCYVLMLHHVFILHRVTASG